ncbi:MAG: hypothetical protein ABS35_29525 [Kaistia sp. SCN 65-12]|nr:MAG: hypothetical protein ABS35_29525 [Kaistia sp. SCN 65-12]
MQRDERKAAVSAYKKREEAAGIYAVRCSVSGTVWVGKASNLDAIQNRLWFTLGLGSCMVKSLQAEWDRHGAGAFRLDVLERLEPEETPYIRDALLKERCLHWRAALSAQSV